MLMITGARGWEKKQWKNDYYPNEIATDWHLTYYTKEFQTAVAPVSLWANHSIEQISEFLTDVPEAYPLLFEKNDNETNEHILKKQKAIDNLKPNWIMFKDDGWQTTTEHYQIKQAEVLQNTNLEKNCSVFSVSSSESLKDIKLEEIMLTIKKEFKQFDVVYVYFDGELISANILNTVKTLRRMLALD